MNSCNKKAETPPEAETTDPNICSTLPFSGEGISNRTF